MVKQPSSVELCTVKAQTPKGKVTKHIFFRRDVHLLHTVSTLDGVTALHSSTVQGEDQSGLPL